MTLDSHKPPEMGGLHVTQESPSTQSYKQSAEIIECKIAFSEKVALPCRMGLDAHQALVVLQGHWVEHMCA